MQKRINAHHLHPDHQKILRFVENSKEPPTRLELGRRFSGSSIEMLVATGHLADAIIRGHDCMMVTALTEKELANLAPWRKREDDHLRTNWAIGAPIKTIAKDLGRTGGEVVSRAWSLKLVRRSHWGTGYIEARNFRRLKCRLIDAERRGLRKDDNGKDLLHRAEQRRFKIGRQLLLSAVHAEAWNVAELDSLSGYQKADMSIRSIAQKMEREAGEVAKKLALYGRRVSRRITDDEYRTLIGGFCGGLGLDGVVALLPGRSKSQVRAWGRRYCPEAYQKSTDWSVADKRKLLVSYLAGIRGNALAALFPHRTNPAVRRYLYGMLHERDMAPFSPVELQIMVAAVKRGESIDDIAKWLARKPETIAGMIKNNRIGQKGRVPMLSREQAVEALRLRNEEKMPFSEIGGRFGVSQATIARYTKQLEHIVEPAADERSPHQNPL